MPTYDFEGGADGNAATTANTGASAVIPGAGNAITLTSTAAVSGALALRFHIGATTNSCYSEFAAVGGTSQSLYVPVRLSADGYNSAGGSTTLVQGYQTGDTTVAFRLSVTNAGSLVISDTGTAHTSTIAADVTAQYGTTVAVRLQMTAGTTTANGTLNARYYTNPLAAVGTFIGSELAVTTWNLGAGAAFGKFRVGITSVQATVGGGRDTIFDYLSTATGASWIAPPAAAAAPTANGGADQYPQTGDVVTVTGAGTIGSGGGSITGYAWRVVSVLPAGNPFPTVTSPSTQTTTVTGFAAGTVTLGLIVTQSGGALTSTEDTVVLWVHPASGVAVQPRSVTKDPAITREGTGLTDMAVLADADPTTLLRWPDGPSGEKVTIIWCPCGPQVPDVRLDLATAGAGTVTYTVNHYREDGVTLLDGPYTPTASSATVTTVGVGISGAAVTALGAALSDRRALVTTITAA